MYKPFIRFHYGRFHILFAMHNEPFHWTDFLLLLLIIFRWFRKFRKYVIFRYKSKIFPRYTFCLLFVWITKCRIIFLIISYYFEIFLCWIVITYTKKTILSEQDLLSHYLYHNLKCCQNLNIQYFEMKYIKTFYQ